LTTSSSDLDAVVEITAVMEHDGGVEGSSVGLDDHNGEEDLLSPQQADERTHMLLDLDEIRERTSQLRSEGKKLHDQGEIQKAAPQRNLC
jgi:hypothetical protein